MPDAGTRAPLLRLAEGDDVAGLVAGGEPGLGAGEPARLQDGRDQRVVAKRAVATRAARIASVSSCRPWRVRAWFKWLARENHILSNSASELELPRPERRLPAVVLTAEAVMSVPDIAAPLGLRDPAMLDAALANDGED